MGTFRCMQAISWAVARRGIMQGQEDLCPLQRQNDGGVGRKSIPLQRDDQDKLLISETRLANISSERFQDDIPGIWKVRFNFGSRRLW
jgi:hypothetical protein